MNVLILSAAVFSLHMNVDDAGQRQSQYGNSSAGLTPSQLMEKTRRENQQYDNERFRRNAFCSQVPIERRPADCTR